MNIRTCSNCRYEKEDVSSEVCTNCHGIAKGEPSNWENKSCLVCVNFGKGVHVKPCKDCIYNKYKPSFELDKKENKEMEEIKTCSNCKHASDGLDDDICEQCSMEDRGGTVCYWEARNKTEGNNSDTKLIRCAVCKYRYKDMDAEPCNSCVNMGRGDKCKGEEVNCRECKYASVNINEEPCKNCSNNAWNCNKDKLTLNLHFEPKETESKQEVYNGVTPSCCTCKHFETNSNNEPCSKCVAICNGIVSYWEERDEETEPQTAREIVEKTVEQRLQEEHFDEHYHDKVQPLEIMQEIMTPEEFRGFLFGNIIKYSCRCGKKDEPQKEFAKLRRYREWYDKAVLCEHIDPRV